MSSIKLDFNNVYQTELNKTGFVLGLGPSLKPHLDYLNNITYSDQQKIIISCNDWDLMTKLQCKYWVIANTQLVVGNGYERFNQHPESILVYADSVDLTPRDKVSELLKYKYLPYDQRHFKDTQCNLPPNHWHQCCKHRIPDRLTIQEYLQSITNNPERYSSANSGIVHGYALAVILGCNPIYITGVDLNYGGGYVDGSAGHNHTYHVDNVVNDFRIIYESAKRLNIESYTISDNIPITKVVPFKNINSLQN